MALAASELRAREKGAELRALLARRGTRVYLALLALATLAGWAFPLTDHLGYELAEAVALLAGTAGAALGIGAARRVREARDPVSPGRSLATALLLSQLVLLLPIALALLDGLRRPICDPLAGLTIYALLACPSALLSCSLGALVGGLFPRRAGLVFAAIFLSTLALSLWPIWRGPQVFAFHHLGGMFPGPIYDEAVGVTSALLWFRFATLLYALGCALAALAFVRREVRATAPGLGLLARFARLALAGLSFAGAASISLHAERHHFAVSIGQLDASLGARIETQHLILHIPREKPELERTLLARDAEASVAEVLEFLDAKETHPARIDVFLYRSAEEKRELIGAADTSFTKPWLRQIHTNDAPAPHPILRHELVHALAADFAPGPFRVPGRLHGLLPDMAFIEGFAVAADWPAHESTVDEEAAALKKLGKLPDLAVLFSPGRFYAEAGPNAYTAAGSFVRYLWRTRGALKLREAYQSPDGISALGDINALISSYQAWLDTVLVPERVLGLAQLRFSTPSITRKTCAHEEADLAREAGQAAAEGNAGRAAELWKRCALLEPDDPGLLLQERRERLAAGQPQEARALEEQVLAHPKLSQPQRAQLLTELGDAAWRAEDRALAARRYAEASALPQAEASERALHARQYALQDAARWPAARRLLIDNDAGPETWLLLRELDLARPQEGFAAYLLAKQAQNARGFSTCLRFSGSALARELPGPLFTAEALRMRAACAVRSGDVDAARRALLELTRDPSEARRLEAERLLRRLP